MLGEQVCVPDKAPPLTPVTVVTLLSSASEDTAHIGEWRESNKCRKIIKIGHRYYVMMRKRLPEVGNKMDEVGDFTLQTAFSFKLGYI